MKSHIYMKGSNAAWKPVVTGWALSNARVARRQLKTCRFTKTMDVSTWWVFVVIAVVVVS